jgi:hypothetical protein
MSSANQEINCMNKSWYESLGGIIWAITRFIFAPFMAIGTPILAIYGASHASAVDFNALQLRSTQIPMLIGTAGDSQDCSKYTPCSSVGQRTYLVFPEALLKGEITAVNHKDNIITVDRQPIYGYIAIASWAACVALTWRYCIRPWFPTSKRSRSSRL